MGLLVKYLRCLIFDGFLGKKKDGLFFLVKRKEVRNYILKIGFFLKSCSLDFKVLSEDKCNEMINVDLKI